MAHQFTQKQLEEYEEAFKAFDKDGDGTITRKELVDIMEALGQDPTEENLTSMLGEVDTDGNGIIDINEFLTYIIRHQENSNPEKEMLDVFRLFDRSGDGYITADELRAIMTKCDEKMTDEAVILMMEEADKDGDGRIDYHEFVKVMMTQ